MGAPALKLVPPSRIRTLRIKKKALERLKLEIAGLEIALMELDPTIKYFVASLTQPVHPDDGDCCNPIRFTFTAYHDWRGKPPGEGELLILNPNDALKRRQREASAPFKGRGRQWK